MAVKTTVFPIESYDRSDYPQFAALYDGDGEDAHLFIECVAYGQPEECDYGVPRSPVWTEIADIECEEFTVNGVVYRSYKALTAEIGVEAAESIHEICAEAAAEKDDWEE